MTIISDGVYNELSREPMLLAAHSCARNGIPIFPCDPRSKQPLSKHGFYDATTDQAIIHDWWTRWPAAMIGMPTGMVTEMFVVDLDTKGDGIQHFADLCEQHGGVPATRTSTTPSGGRHLYFHYPQDRHIRNSASKLGRGIDVRGQGGYVIVAPSRRHDGAAYSWDTSGEDVGIARAPGWLLDLIDPPAAPAEVRPTNDEGEAGWAQAALQSELGRVLSASEGSRNDTLVRASYALGQIVAGGALTHEKVFRRLLNAALAVGLGRGEAEGTISSGMKAGATQPRQRPSSGSGDRPAPPDRRSSEPLPLFPPLPLEEPYPLEALGPLLSRVAGAIARTVQVPNAIAGQAVLSVASLAAQALADVRMPFGQCRPLSLYCLSIAASGDRKTTADNEALKPVRRYEQDLRDVYEREMREWRMAQAAWAAQKRKIETDRKLDITKRRAELQVLGPEPERPLYPILIVPEPTIEGLTRMWVDALAALGIFSAEGGQFLGGPGMSPEHKLKTGAALSAFWDGLGQRRVRASDGLIDLVGRRLAVHLMVQLDPAAAFLADPVLRSQGLLSRCLVAAPASLSGTRFSRDPEPSDIEAIEVYTTHVHRVLAMPRPLADGKRNELKPRELVLSPKAATALRLLSDQVESQCGSEGELTAIRDIAAKAAEHAARIAGVVTIIEDPQAGEISAEMMAHGITLTEWYIREALRLHGAARTDPKLLDAHRLLEWLKRQTGPVIRFRDILRGGPRDLRAKGPAEGTIRTLVDHGLITEVSKKPLAYRVLEEPPS